MRAVRKGEEEREKQRGRGEPESEVACFCRSPHGLCLDALRHFDLQPCSCMRKLKTERGKRENQDKTKQETRQNEQCKSKEI